MNLNVITYSQNIRLSL